MHVPLTPLEFKRRAVRLFGRKIGVVDGPRRFTYQAFGERATRLANALRAGGVRSGDRVATLAYNGHPLLEAYFGVLEARGILLPVNVRMTAGEMADVLSQAGARFLLADRELRPAVETIESRLAQPPEVVWIGGAPEGRSEPEYDAWLADASDAEAPEQEVDENAVAELFFTSGTSGRARGVMLTHRNLYLHALSLLVTFRASERDVQLHTIPLFHVNGWGTPQALTAVGATHVVLRKFDPAEVLRLVECERVTRLFAVPTMLAMLLEHPDVRRRDLSSLELINMGGAPTAPAMVERAEQLLGCRVIGSYGLTETSPVVAFAADKTTLAGQSSDARIRRQASTGMPVIGAEVTIVDEAGRELPWDGQSVGEVVVRANTVAAGYWNDPAATAEAIRDGWLHTGDLATVDPEGYVLIVDRKKDLIISGGENISSVEIEKCLVAHPAVLESAVVAMADERWGEAPCAFVVLRDGAEASAAELVAHCRAELAGFKVPRAVRIVEALPKGGTGKILKRELRKIVPARD